MSEAHTAPDTEAATGAGADPATDADTVADLSGLAEPPLPPVAEGQMTLADGRALAWAEFGDPDGDVVLWCHGTPGARHQIPPDAPAHALATGVRIVTPDRPGVGGSHPDPNRDLVSWAGDVNQLLDHLGVPRAAVAGLSGGGPHVLALAHELPERTSAGALLGGMVPLVGPDAPHSTPELLPLLMGVAHRLRGVVGALMTTVLRPLTREIGERVMDVALTVLPESDRAILGSPGFRAMFVADLYEASRQQFRAQSQDVSAFGRGWGFSPRDITVPIRSWHGSADALVPLAHARHLAALIPGAELEVFEGEGHFAGYARAPEVLDWLMTHHRSRTMEGTT